MTAPLPLFGDAYLADTRHLSLEEHGAYLQLLMIAWRTETCTLPDDDKRIAKMLGVTAGRWSKLKTTVMAFWELTSDGWKQKRLSKERAFSDEKRAKNISAAKSRWSKQGVENKQTVVCERISERNAPPTNYTDTYVSGADSPDPVKKLFDAGLELLTSTGSTPSHARSMIGRWRKNHGDGAVLAAVTDARLKAITQPVAWIEKRLAAGKSNDTDALFREARKYAQGG